MPDAHPCPKCSMPIDPSDVDLNPTVFHPEQGTVEIRLRCANKQCKRLFYTFVSIGDLMDDDGNQPFAG